MKKLLLPIAAVIAVSVLLSSCGTLFTAGGGDYRDAVSAHQRNDYVRAIRSLEQALAANPTFPEALELYPVVFNEAQAHYNRIIQDHESRDDRKSADQVYSAYVDLQNIHTLAQQGNHRIVSTEDFSSQVQQAASTAGQRWFDYGLQLFNQGEREHYKQAADAFERAKQRDPQIDEIDQWISDALDNATITLMVVGIGPDEAFHTLVLNDIKSTFASDRFIKVIETESFSDTGPLVGPTDLAAGYGKNNDIDYLLEITVNHTVESINERVPLRLPGTYPIFDGRHVTIGYVTKNLVSYRLFDLDTVNVIAGDTFVLEDEPFTFEYNFVQAHGVQELNLDGSGGRNLRYVSSSSNSTVINEAMHRINRDIRALQIPPEVTNPHNSSIWTEYFLNRYSRFSEFSRHESGKMFFYGIEVIKAELYDNTYYLVTHGSDVDEAIQQSRIITGYMNGLSHAARTLAEKERDSRGLSYHTIGEEVGKRITSVF